MSKLKVINGEKTINESNIRFLRAKIEERGKTNLSNKELYVFAYHFATNGDIISARRFLKRIGSFYYTSGIYKDLYKALLSWSMRDTIWNEQTMKEYEFFIVVKRSIPIFRDIDFPFKKEFIKFSKEFHKEITVVM